MCSSTASFDWRRWLLPPIWLVVAGVALHPLEGRLAQPALRPVADLAGSGGTLAVLGGMRSVLAGGCWLRTNLAWERREAVEVMTWLNYTVAADERPLTFWLNGARMIAYDLPAWESEAGPESIRQRIRCTYARAALEFLQLGQARRGPSADLLIDMANIRLRVLGDRAGAAELFRQAAELPDAPWYAARIHAELLRELGRPAEALAWLRRILPGLRGDEPAAQRAIVLERIKGLEQEVAGK